MDEWSGGFDLYPENDEKSSSWPGGAGIYPENDQFSADYVCPGDFHMHSSYSDGVLRPRELMELAKARGVR
jgi:hypothetical protein